MTPITIHPIEVLGETADAVVITSVQVDLFQSASVFVDVVQREPDAGHRILAQRQISLTPQEYDGWGDDDEYLVQIVLGRLGVTRTYDSVPPAP